MKFCQQKLFIQEKILLSVHKGCTIEEARWKEYNLYGVLTTLPRVLTALGGNDYARTNGDIRNMNMGKPTFPPKKVCMRKLLKEKGTDATLRDQTEETQETVAKLLGRKE